MTKPYQNSNCPVDEPTRMWLEESMLWLFNAFGEENVKNKKVLVPNYDDFPIKYNQQAQSAFETLNIVAQQMEVSLEEIHLDVYNQDQEEIDTGNTFGNGIFLEQKKGEKYSGGMYFGKQDDGKYHIALKENKLKNPINIVATLAHELAHVKLLGEKRIEENDEDLTDLTTIIFGLGIFNANSAFQMRKDFRSWGYSKNGYLSQMEWAYALAVYAYLREEKTPDWIEYLSLDIKNDFLNSETFIKDNVELIFKFEEKEQEISEYDKILYQINEGNENRDFEQIINGYGKLLLLNPDNVTALNNIGYNLIQQKKYAEAINYLDKAIVLDKKWDFPYNNRGYCKLQLGDLPNALLDIKKACDINPFNSYAWRNLGAYYYVKNELDNALFNFEEAEKIDSETELINFYLARTYEKLGDVEKAKFYLNKSIKLKEHNDSLIL